MGLKKFLICAVLFTAIFSTCNAAQVQLSNEKYDDFFLKMASFLYNDNVQKRFPFFITHLDKDEKGIPEHNLDVWYAFFGKKEADTPDGQVMLFVNKDGYVSSVKVTILKNENKDINYSIVAGSALWTMGLTSEETQHLMTGGETNDGIYVSDVQNAALNKKFILMTAEETDRIQVAIFASDNNE